MPLPGSNVMPTQESGRKPARPLPFQPNVNLVDLSAGTNGALEAYSSSATSHPSSRRPALRGVQQPRGGAVARGLPGRPSPNQYTNRRGRSERRGGRRRGGSGDTAYDITVVGPNRFLRRYVGNTKAAGADARVKATYYDADQHGHGCNDRNDPPKLKLLLSNDARKSVTFTITFNNYSSRSHQTVRVDAHDREEWQLDACGDSDGLVRPDRHRQQRLQLVAAAHGSLGDRSSEHQRLIALRRRST